MTRNQQQMYKDISDLTKSDKCIFVGTPQQLIKKYKQNTNNDG